MVKLRHSKPYVRKKAVEHLLSKMRSAYVIVEGRHDVAALHALGIDAHTYESTMRSFTMTCTSVLIFTDNDRRGREKAEKLSSFFAENGVAADTATGTRLLKILNSVHVEEILMPVVEATEENMAKKERNTKHMLKS